MESLALFFYLFIVTGNIISAKILLNDSDIDSIWSKYKEKFGKKYAQPEDERRKKIWEQNIKNNLNHNLLADLGKKSFRRGINEYSDLNSDEYRKNLLGYVKPSNAIKKGVPFDVPKKFKVPLTVGANFEDGNNYMFLIVTPKPQDNPKHVQGQSLQVTKSPKDQVRRQNPLNNNANNVLPNSTDYLDYLPGNIDWRNYGVVTPVKNQGLCGSSWSFSTTGSLEGQLAFSTGVLANLSEQQLIDCATDNLGCGGGSMDFAYQFIIQNGIELDADYPYTGKQNQCKANPSDNYANVEGYYSIPYGNETLLMIAVATHGPISVAIDASQPSFQSYSYGIYDEPDCDSENVNHAVLVVGYGTESDSDYWLIKNSWGTSWGDQGYFKLARNSNNTCGVATAASFPDNANVG